MWMNHEAAGLWTDRSTLRHVQYRTDANLVARQSIYAYEHPRMYLPAVMLDVACLRGDETVVDVGCGNGVYLGELTRRRHSGPVLGVDLSPGMLAAARGQAPRASLIAADAAALPLHAETTHLTLAMHMLHHVPDALAVVRELRRITHRGGQVLVALRGEDHLREMRDAIATALSGALERVWVNFREPLCLDAGAEVLASEFQVVTRHDFTGELLIPTPQPVEDYIRSMLFIQKVPESEDLIAAVGRLIFRGGEPFRVRTHSGCLVCT